MSTTSESRQSHTQEESVHMTNRSSVQTGVTCPHPGLYMVEIFGTSVRNGIAHKVILTGQFVRTGTVPQLGYARVLSSLPRNLNLTGKHWLCTKPRWELG